MTKYIFVTGGVVSSIGKGITASSIGALLKARGIKVFMQKFDPYINIDPGTMSPLQHGEVFVTDDGAETDLDLGHYERFIDENLNKHSSVTTGKIYQSVIKRERRGDYLGKTVQVIPHITNQIKKKLYDVASHTNPDVVIAEIGGTVGDIESLPFIEAIRQMRQDIGVENTLYIHNTLIPFLKTANEIKTKPTQHSVKELMSYGVKPDILALRSEVAIDEATKEKIALFCDIKKEAIFEVLDVEIIYQVILNLHAQGTDEYILNHFKLTGSEVNISPWVDLINRISHLRKKISIGIVGKYVAVHDAYLSIAEALKHAGYANNLRIDLQWINSSDLTAENIAIKLASCRGIVVPGGFGERGSNGKLLAIEYARKNHVPFLGICFGMQLAVIEYARHVLGLEDANTTEIDSGCQTPIVHLITGKSETQDKGATLRLGLYDCKLRSNSLVEKLYGTNLISERHRHRYEINNQYLSAFQGSNFIFSGINESHNLVEIVEITDHPYFIGVQFHPEFTSRPLRPHPLFMGFIQAAKEYCSK
ncbi:MAG: CTP synthase [Acholeplasmatales bacterium]|jgi:CTP synthase|nr:CTP synthase [Acholeplasmatales bacterium]